MSSEEHSAEEDYSFSPSASKGELPKIGEIIEVPMGIRWEYPKKTGKKLTKEEREMQKHRKKFYKTGGKNKMATKTPPTVDIDGELIDDDGQPDIKLSFSEDDEEKQEKHPKVKKQKYIRAEGEVGEILREMAEGRPPKTRKTGRGIFERGVEWVEKEVPLTLSQEQNEYYHMMGLPTKVAKLVPIPVWRPVKQAELTHTHIRKVEVGHFGMMYPVRRYNKIKMLETHMGVIIEARSRKFKLVRLNDGVEKTMRYSSLEGYSIEPATTDIVDGDVARVKGNEFQIKDARKVPDAYSDIVPGMIMIYYSDADDAPRERIKGYYNDITPTKPRKIPTPPKSYKGDIKYGDKISFIDYDDEDERMAVGIVINFRPTQFVVRGNPPSYKEYLVDYDDQNTKVIQRVKKKIEIVKPKDLYDKAVPQELREIVRKNLIKIAYDLLELPDTPVNIATQSPVDSFPIVPPDLVEWEDYYRREYMNYHYAMWRDHLMHQVTDKELTEQAKQHIKNTRSIQYILDYLSVFYGEDVFEISAGEFLDRIKQSSKPSDIIDVELEMSLSKLDKVKLYNATGKEYADILTDAIINYLTKYPVNVEQVKSEMVNEYINTEYSKLDPSQDHQLQKRFDDEQLPLVKKMYDEYIKEHKRQMKEYEKNEQDMKKNVKKSRKTDKLASQKKKVARQILKFEEEMLARADHLTFNYLILALVPYVFMNTNGGVGSQAKFFQEKVKKGGFKISRLDTANMAHYLPELFMNKSLSDKDIEDVSKEIHQELLNIANRLLETYILVKNPTQQRISSRRPVSMINWDKYLVNPIQVCQADSNSGYEIVRDKDGQVVYDVKEEVVYKTDSKGQIIRGKQNKPKIEKIVRKKVARVEPIELGSLVICYTPATDKFTCHSEVEILRLISKSDKSPIVNPYTGKPFPPKFIKRMRRRYASKIDKVKIYDSPPIGGLSDSEEIISLSSDLEIEEEVEITREIKNMNELSQILDDSQVTVLFVYASWNEPSQKIMKEGGVWDKLIGKYEDEDVRFEKVDNDTFDKMKEEFDIKRLRVPTILIFSGDELRNKIMGTRDLESKISDKIDEILE